MLTRSPARSRRIAALLLAAVTGLALSSCSNDDGGPSASPEDVMAQAKQQLDDTSGVNMSLSTSDLPADVQGIEEATGTATHAPAFDGTITVVLSGQAFDVPVIAVDGTVYAQVPLTPGWQDIDPSDYGAPDPAMLMDTEKGFSSLLPATTGLESGQSVRGGENNDEILTEYTGTVPGDVVKNVIPSATGDFDATYTVSEDGELRQATLTGVFYPDSDSMTYTISFDDYGTEKEISAP
ncbi:MAG TPA: LppX_LprAFG lipoprotein [Nocardioides sp.]|nr:LppX_LprAFG lipoprotein [Nocardioides sp.]